MALEMYRIYRALACNLRERNSAEAGCYQTVPHHLFELKRVASACLHWPKPEKPCAAIPLIFKSVALSLSDCRFVIEPSGSGDIFADDSDLVRYVDGLHLV